MTRTAALLFLVCAAAAPAARSQNQDQAAFERGIMDVDRDVAALRARVRVAPDRALLLVRNLLRAASAPGASPKVLRLATLVASSMPQGELAEAADAEVHRHLALDAAGQRQLTRYEQLSQDFRGARNAGNATAARALAAASLEVAQSSRNEWLEANAHRRLADVLKSEGGYSVALTHLRHAAELLNRATARVEHASCLADAGALEAMLGEHASAEASLARALELTAVTGDQGERARALEERGGLCSAEGSYGEAVQSFRSALAVWRERNDGYRQGRVLVHLGGVYSEVGLFADAEECLREALALFGGEPAAAGRTVTAQGLARLDEGRVTNALELLDRGLALATQSDDAAGAGNCQRQRGRALAALGRLDQAERAYRAALEWSEAAGQRLFTALDRTGLADVLAELGRSDEARSLYRGVLDLGEDLHTPEATWRARVGLGRIAEAANADADAHAHYSAAIEDVEQLRSLLAAPSMRRQFLGDKLDVYWRAARLRLRRGDAEAAFGLAEAAKSRTLVELMAYRPLESEPESPALARLRDAEARLLALERRLTASSRGEPGAVPRHELEEQLRKMRALHEQERLDVELGDPRFAVLAGVARAPRASELQSALPAGAALCEYLVGQDSTLLWVLREEGMHAFELPVGAAELEARIERILRPIDAMVAGRLDVSNLRFDSRAAHGLWQALVRPAAAALSGATQLIVVPDGPLRRLPFALLVTRREPRPVRPGVLFAQYHGCRFLVEEHSIRYLPAAAVLPHEPGPGPGTGTLIVADPDPLPTTAPRLAGSREEGTAVAELAEGQPTLLFGADATEARWKTEAPRAAVLHVAAHATLDGRRPAYSRIALSPSDGEDGWLHAFEVERLPLQACRVVLSTCQSAGNAGRGEGLLGLARSFLRAGARSVTASLWVVDDRATAMLMRRLHGAIAQGEDPGAALSRAQVELLQSARRDASPHFHPFFWAAFVQY